MEKKDEMEYELNLLKHFRDQSRHRSTQGFGMFISLATLYVLLIWFLLENYDCSNYPDGFECNVFLFCCILSSLFVVFMGNLEWRNKNDREICRDIEKKIQKRFSVTINECCFRKILTPWGAIFPIATIAILMCILANIVFPNGALFPIIIAIILFLSIRCPIFSILYYTKIENILNFVSNYICINMGTLVSICIVSITLIACAIIIWIAWDKDKDNDKDKKKSQGGKKKKDKKKS